MRTQVPQQRRRLRRVITTAAASTALIAAGLLMSTPSSADLREDVANAKAYLEDLQMQAAAAHGRVEDAQYALEKLQGKRDKTKGKVQAAKDQLAETQDTIGRYAATAYRSGGLDSSLQLLLVEDAQQFLDQAVVLDIVASGQSAALRKTQVARLKLAQATAELQQQEQAEQAALADLEARSAEFDNAVSAADDYLNGLEEELRQQIEAERARRAAEARAAADAAAAALAAGQSSGGSSGGGNSSGGSSGGTTSANGGPNDGGSYNGNSGGGGGYSGGSGVSSDRAAIVVEYALAQVGKPYSFAASPPSSWDCTKLTSWAWAQVGVQLTPYSYTQAQEVRRISPDELQPGDLLFFFKNGAHHASMYIGGGMIVEASSPEVGVRVTDVWNGWNVAHFSWAGRPYG